MFIPRVSSYVSRAINLAKVWTDYRDYMDQRDAKLEPPAEAPAAPLERPKQAVHHPSHGSRWFSMSFARSMPRRVLNTGSAKPGVDGHREGPAAAASQRTEHKIVEAIPANDRSEQAVQTEKVRIRPYVDTVSTGRSAVAKTLVEDAQYGNGLDKATAANAIRQRTNFLILLERKLGGVSLFRI
jgi:hypothetical protein